MAGRLTIDDALLPWATLRELAGNESSTDFGYRTFNDADSVNEGGDRRLHFDDGAGSVASVRIATTRPQM